MKTRVVYRSGEPGRHIALSLPDAPVLVRCDPLRIERALGNLVSNALKYSPQEAWVELSVSERGDGEEAVIAVADRGVGLSDAEVRHLFQPFSRVGSLRAQVPGVGLGLATAAKMVSAHGGHIDVTSAPGKGARFEVRLPGARRAAACCSGEDRAAPTVP